MIYFFRDLFFSPLQKLKNFQIIKQIILFKDIFGRVNVLSPV